MEANRNAVPAGLAFQLQPTAPLARDKGSIQFVDQLRKQLQLGDNLFEEHYGAIKMRMIEKALLSGF